MLDGSIRLTWSVAIAPARFENATPQQGFYESTRKQPGGDSGAATAGFEPGSKARRLEDVVKFSPFLTRVAQDTIERRRAMVNSRRVRRHSLPYAAVGRF